MSWLFPYYVFLDYYAKTATIAMPGIESLEWESVYKPISLRIAYAIRSQNLAKIG